MTENLPEPSIFVRLNNLLFKPTDAIVLAYFRFAFGLILSAAILKKIISGAVYHEYAAPVFHFYYAGFSWVKVHPPGTVELLFFVLLLSSILITLGFYTRGAAALFFVSFVYIFLQDQAYFLNHDYLICLLAGTLAVIPCNRVLSVDSYRNRELRSETVPVWSVLLLQFTIALPYVFGGIAKINGDWLRGQPMRSWLPESPLPHLLGEVATTSTFALGMSWGGMLFDLLVVPLLMYRKTRILALVCAIGFHLTNAIFFNIGVFPWLMIFALPAFLPASWIRTALKQQPLEAEEILQALKSKKVQSLITVLFCFYLALHCALPFRHLLIPGNASWTEEGHLFAWRMMLRDKNTALQIVIKNNDTHEKIPIDPSQWLTRFQIEMMGQNPELMRQFAHFLADQSKDSGIDQCSVHFIVITSLNGRKPQLMIDPRLDLSKIPPVSNPIFGAKSWVNPLKEPFQDPPWELPAINWLEHIDEAELIEEI